MTKTFLILTVNVRNLYTFGFQTGPHRSVVDLFEQKIAKIRTNLFGFQTILSVRKPNVAVRTFGFRTYMLLYGVFDRSNDHNPNDIEPNDRSVSFRR